MHMVELGPADDWNVVASFDLLSKSSEVAAVPEAFETCFIIEVQVAVVTSLQHKRTGFITTSLMNKPWNVSRKSDRLIFNVSTRFPKGTALEECVVYVDKPVRSSDASPLLEYQRWSPVRAAWVQAVVSEM
jgi:hypothetical protein